VLFMGILIAAAAAASATGRVTLPLLASLFLSWLFIPLLHVAVACAVIASAPRRRHGIGPAVTLLLMGHAPWSLWLLLAPAMAMTFGFAAWHPMIVAALVPLALTCRILHAFCLEVLHTSPRGAIARTLAHQALTWLVALLYLEKAVGLVPRIHGWLS
jgi:hypothetical protein